jgi:hypothetical protein
MELSCIMDAFRSAKSLWEFLVLLLLFCFGFDPVGQTQASGGTRS